MKEQPREKILKCLQCGEPWGTLVVLKAQSHRYCEFCGAYHWISKKKKLSLMPEEKVY